LNETLLVAVVVAGGLFLFGGLLHWAGSSGIPGDATMYAPVGDLPDGYRYNYAGRLLYARPGHDFIDAPVNLSEEGVAASQPVVRVLQPGVYRFNGSNTTYEIRFRRSRTDVFNEVFPLVLMAIGILLPIGMYGWQRLMK
jgi:hypothetical protein